MTRLEFMKTLGELLSDISEEERSEALLYYEDYFEDAGPDREQIIINELGSPDKVAASIKANINTSSQEARDRGYFTEYGYEDDTFHEPKLEIIDGIKKENKTNSNSAKDAQSENNYNSTKDFKNNYYDQNSHKNSDNKGLKIILIIIICIFAIPVGIPILATIFSLLLALLLTVFGIWIAFVAVSIGLTIGGIVSIVAGIIKLVTLPIVGVSVTGVGLVLFGVGLLFTIATVWITTKIIPTVFRFVIDVCRLPFKNRKVAA